MSSHGEVITVIARVRYDEYIARLRGDVDFVVRNRDQAAINTAHEIETYSGVYHVGFHLVLHLSLIESYAVSTDLLDIVREKSIAVETNTSNRLTILGKTLVMGEKESELFSLLLHMEYLRIIREVLCSHKEQEINVLMLNAYPIGWLRHSPPPNDVSPQATNDDIFRIEQLYDVYQLEYTQLVEECQNPTTLPLPLPKEVVIHRRRSKSVDDESVCISPRLPRIVIESKQSESDDIPRGKESASYSSGSVSPRPEVISRAQSFDDRLIPPRRNDDVEYFMDEAVSMIDALSSTERDILRKRCDSHRVERISSTLNRGTSLSLAENSTVLTIIEYWLKLRRATTDEAIGVLRVREDRFLEETSMFIVRQYHRLCKFIRTIARQLLYQNDIKFDLINYLPPLLHTPKTIMGHADVVEREMLRGKSTELKDNYRAGVREFGVRSMMGTMFTHYIKKIRGHYTTARRNYQNTLPPEQTNSVQLDVRWMLSMDVPKGGEVFGDLESVLQLCDRIMKQTKTTIEVAIAEERIIPPSSQWTMATVGRTLISSSTPPVQRRISLGARRSSHRTQKTKHNIPLPTGPKTDHSSQKAEIHMIQADI